jgi:predicted RNA-binding protein
MCEAHAYLLAESGPEMVMENVISLRYDGDQIVLTDLFGDQMRIDGTIKEIALIEHRIYLEGSEAPRPSPSV